MRRDGGNHHEKLGLQRISCATQFTIPNSAGTSPDLVCNYTDTRSSQPNPASCTHEFSYLLISSTSFSSSSPSCSFWSTTLPSSQNRKLSHPSLSLYVMIMSWHGVQHTLSTASTHDCLSSIHSHDYELTPEWSFSFWHASLHDRPPSANSPWVHKGKLTLSHSHGCGLTNWWVESQHPARHPSTASKYLCKLAQLLPPRSHDCGLQIRSIMASMFARSWPPSPYLQSRSITAFMFARSWPPCAYLHTRLITASKCISKLARLPPPCSHNHGLQVHLQTRSITISECISKFTRSLAPSVSPKTLDHGLGVYLWGHSIVIIRRTLNCSQAAPSASPDIPCVDG